MKGILKNRENDIKTLFEIIDNRDNYKENSENGLVILLNGSWGSGKTTFLKDVEKYIHNNENYELFTNYNSYSYDFFENPYIPFFANIEDKLNLKDNFGKLINCTNKNFINGIVCSSYTIVNSIFKKHFDIDVNDLKDTLMGVQNEDYLKKFKDFEKCKNNIKDKLKNYCKNKTQIIIIDELDRCKPTFAMETLEIIKHFFDIENCVFIIAVDKLQLQEFGKTIYGQEMDSEKYFSKFFDYQYNLLPLNFNEIVDTSEIEDLQEIIKRSTYIFNYLNISSRDSKKIFSEFVGIYRKYTNSSSQWTSDQSIVVIFFLTLKYVDLLFYNELMSGNYNRYYQKINNSINPMSNNYSKLLSIKIGNNKDFNYLCNRLTSSLELKYIDKVQMNTSNVFNDKTLDALQHAAKDLSVYIPQITPNITFKETIENIVN